MKTARIILFGSVALLVVYVLLIRWSASDDPITSKVDVKLSHSISVIPEDAPILPIQNPVEMPAAGPAVMVEVEQTPAEPVQPIEERGDAMLSEIDALQGMPFDQAVTMPFD